MQAHLLLCVLSWEKSCTLEGCTKSAGVAPAPAAMNSTKPASTNTATSFLLTGERGLWPLLTLISGPAEATAVSALPRDELLLLLWSGWALAASISRARAVVPLHGVVVKRVETVPADELQGGSAVAASDQGMTADASSRRRT